MTRRLPRDRRASNTVASSAVALNPAPTFVQSGSALTNSSTGSALVATMGQNFGVGNMVVVFARVSTPGDISLAFLGSGTPSLAQQSTTVLNGTFNEYAFAAVNNTAGQNTVTLFLLANGLTVEMLVYEASGAGVVDAIAGASQGGVPLGTTVQVTPVYANTLLVAGAFGDLTSGNPSWTSGITNTRIALHDTTAGAYLLGDTTLTAEGGVQQTAKSNNILSSTGSIIALTLRHS